MSSDNKKAKKMEIIVISVKPCLSALFALLEKVMVNYSMTFVINTITSNIPVHTSISYRRTRKLQNNGKQYIMGCIKKKTQSKQNN